MFYPKHRKTYVTHTKSDKNVHSSLTFNSTKLETMPMSTCWRIDKQMLTYLYSEIVLSNKKKPTAD